MSPGSCSSQTHQTRAATTTATKHANDGAGAKEQNCTVFETCGPHRFHKDGRRVYLETNKGDVDLTRLVLFDPETGKEELIDTDPMKRVDFGRPIFSEATDELVGTSYEDERVRLYFLDKAWKADYKRLRRASRAGT